VSLAGPGFGSHLVRNALLPATAPVTALRRVSLAVPVHDDEAVLPELLRRVRAVLDATPGGPHEMVFVDDGSRDRSRLILEAEARLDARLVVVSLSRTFGREAALAAAADFVRGDCVLLMDGGLRDAPEALPALLARLDEGFDIVWVRRPVVAAPGWRRAGYHLAYRVIAAVSGSALSADAGDLALLSRRALEQVRALPERERHFRGLRHWVGFRQSSIEGPGEPTAGERPASLARLVGTALDGAFAFSVAPLRLTGAIGAITVLGAALYAPWALYLNFVLGRPRHGLALAITLLAFLLGAVLVSLWIVGESLRTVYDEVKRRPLYVVEGITRGSDIRSA
jgi:glycosyltransferase involved in cell wall biosynthesis